MEKFYWAVEFVRVLIAYVFIMYLWPSVVFKKHLKKKKSRTYKFAFCSVVQVIVVNTGVLGLGLIKLLNVYVFNILFYGAFLFFLFKDVKIEKQTLLKGKYLVSGTYGVRSFFSDLFRFIKKHLSRARRSFLDYMRGHWFEYSMLFLMVVFGLAYFSISPFEENSYGFGDLYTHHSWVHELVHGNIFAGGIYPEAMHCFIAVENFSFDISIYNALLFTGPIFTSTILVSIYIMFRELFKWKYTPMVALALVLIVDVRCSLSVTSMSRWMWTMPQEYGFPAMFFCVAYLIRYFKNGVYLPKVKRRPKFLRDDDLLIFTFSLAATIAAHFYATIMAFMLCVAVAVVLIRHFFSKKFLPFVVACIAGLVISMAPMLGALVEGYKFQGSIRWALSLILTPEQLESLYGEGIDADAAIEAATRRDREAAIKARKEREERDKKKAGTTSNSNSSSTDKSSSKTNASDSSAAKDSQAKTSDIDKGNNQEAGTETTDTSPSDKEAYNPGTEGKVQGPLATVLTAEGIADIVDGITADEPEEVKEPSVLEQKLSVVYYNGYVAMNGSERTDRIIFLSFAAIGVWILLRIYIFIRRRMVADYVYKGDEFDGYLPIVIASFIFTATYCMGALGLPEILEQYRVCSVAFIMIMALFAIPVDLFGEFVISRLKEKYTMLVATLMVAGVYIGAKLTGAFHGYLVIELTRYNSSVMVTNAITRVMGKGANNFTIVATTDELYPVLGYGFHEELITFINSSETVSYTLPTEYVFIMLEKKCIGRAQHHLANGPSWLAEDKYNIYYGNTCSVEPEIGYQTIAEEYANIYFGRFPNSSSVYNTLWQRVLLNSKVYVWCQKFNAMYPNEMHTFYEDDNIICYYLRQNPRNLYELAAMDPSVMVPPEDYAKPFWPEQYQINMVSDEDFEDEEDEENEDANKDEAD